MVESTDRVVEEEEGLQLKKSIHQFKLFLIADLVFLDLLFFKLCFAKRWCNIDMREERERTREVRAFS